MPRSPLPEAAVALLRKPNPAVITTLRQDGQPISTATWATAAASVPGSLWSAGTAGAR
jgi:hypothetical protein